MFKSREYKSGSRWAFWRWSFVDNEFITRLHIIKTPWFAIALHWIHKPDPEPFLHDHPVTFLSIILRGWYEETRTYPNHTGPRSDQPGSPFDSGIIHRWFNFIRATSEDRHTITSCDPRTVTLCFMGPKLRDWGYHTDKGWVHWKEYAHAKYRQSKT